MRTSKFESLPTLRTELRICMCIAAFGGVLSAAGAMLTGCSTRATNKSNTSHSPASDSSTGGSPAMTAGHAGTPPTSSDTAGKPSSSGASGSSGAGTQSMGTGGVAAHGDVTPTADAAAAAPTDAAADAGPMRDCTPVAWENRHMLENPKLVAVADDAGKGMPFDQSAGLTDYDYEMHEFFFSGTSPAYTTRMVVKRPKDPAKFSGTVFVEWYNVSGQIDFAVLWANSREYFMREGHVFIAVSAQQVGADALKNYDPERYAPIQHPGDDYADAIFSQAAVAMRLQSETLLGPCMPVRAVIATGQSQSAFQLAQYVDSAHASAEVFDGYLIHSGLEPASNNPGVPTFVIFTMTEGNGSLQDGPTLVEWMVAGATHNDKRVTTRGAELGTSIGVSVSMCMNPMNEFPSYRVYNAALDWLNRWVRKGERPPAGMPFQMANGQLALDDHNNVLGGVRIEDIDVPIATYGLNNGPTDPTDVIGLLACGLGGETIPFTDAELMTLYPTHDDYVKQYTASADKALANGYLLQADYDDAVKQAQAAAVPK